MKKIIYIAAALFITSTFCYWFTMIRTSQTTMGIGFVNVMDYIPLSADSTTDVTTNIRAANAALTAMGGGTLYFPSGRQYLVSDSIHITKPTNIISYGGTGLFFGGGTGGRATTKPTSTILMSSLTKNVFVIDAPGSQIHNIAGYNTNVSTTPTSGHFILLNDATGFRQDNVSIYYFYIGEEILNGLYYTIHDCNFIGCVNKLLILRDLAVADEGDQRVYSNYFTAGLYPNMDAILYTSGGGLHLSDNKFNWVGGNQMRDCIISAMTSNTVDLSVTNNSAENFTRSFVSVKPKSGVVNSDIIINDNQITPGVLTTTSNIIQLGDSTNAPYNVSVIGNTFHSLIVGSGTGSTATGFNVWSAAPFLTIGPNANVVYDSGGGMNTSNENYYFYSTDHLNLQRQQTIYYNPSGTGMTFDPKQGINQSFKITGNGSIDFKNCYPSNFKLYVLQDATGGHTVTWGGTTTVVFTGNNKVNLLPNGVTVIDGYYDNTLSETVLTIENSSFIGTYGSTTTLNAITPNPGATAFVSPNYYLYNGTAWIAFNANSYGTGLTLSGSTVTNNLSTGISGDQTVIGSTTNGGNLTLQSSTGTRGTIHFGISGGYNEANGLFGVGVFNPLCVFDGGTAINTSNYQQRLGGMYMQSYSTNLTFAFNNGYYGASGPTREQSGYVVGVEYYNGTMNFMGADNGTGVWTRNAGAKYDFSNGGSFGFGGTIDVGPNDWGGATVYADATGFNFNKDPAISTGAYYILTKNASTGYVEKILANKGHTIFTPTTGSSLTLINNQYNIINPSGTLLALTINFPSSPVNNDEVRIKFTQAITTVTYSGGTVGDGITAPTAGGYVTYTYDSASTTWY